jgi:hypothetical protein
VTYVVTSYVDKNKRRKEARTNLLGANMRRLLNLLACLALFVVGCIINGSTGLCDSLDDFELLPPSNPRETSNFQQHNYYIKIEEILKSAWIQKTNNTCKKSTLNLFFEERNPFQLLHQEAAAADRSKSQNLLLPNTKFGELT